MRHPKLISLVMLLIICIINTSKAQLAYGANELNIGIGYTHTNYPSLPAIESGEGIFGHFHVSFLELLFLRGNPTSGVTFGDLVGGEFGVGARTLNKGSFTDPFMPGDNGISPILIDFGLDLGLQLQFSPNDDVSGGIKYYYHGCIDGANSWIVDKTNNNFDLFDFMGRYKNCMAEWSFSHPPSIFWHANTGDPNNGFFSLSFKYIPRLKKKGNYFGIQWNQYSNAYQATQFTSNNIRLLYGQYF